MSFYTSLTFSRPRKPPAITASDLARFISRLAQTGALSGGGFQLLQVKFGGAIDQDEIPVSEINEWDLELDEPADVNQIVESLSAAGGQLVYRAYVSLGTLTESTLGSITRVNSPENEIDFTPYQLSLQIGPIYTHDLTGDVVAQVGWLGVGVSGDGYLFPWTFSEVVRRIEGSPELDRIVNVCRTTWPIENETLESRMIEMRKKLGQLWPYPDLDRAWDWYWALQETG